MTAQPHLLAHDELHGAPPPGFDRALPGWLERVLGVAALQRVGERALRRSGVDATPMQRLTTALEELALNRFCPEADVGKVPRTGPLLIVANHPHGIVDGLILGQLLLGVRDDVRLLGSRWLGRVPQLRGLLLDVDPTGAADAVDSNRRSMLGAVRWLRAGGALLVFPAGKVATRTWRHRDAIDDTWHPNVARLQRLAGCAVLPMHIRGGNSRLFQLAGLFHSRLRTLLLAREALRMRGRTMTVRVGNPIAHGQLLNFRGGDELTGYLRLRTEILGRRPTRRGPASGNLSMDGHEPIVAPVEPRRLAHDIAALPASQRLTSSGELEVWYAYAPQIPHLLREIGRLREQTFRQVGEGTGKAIDLDQFDVHYQHLFVWHPLRREVVGAYRMVRVGRAADGDDERRLYTNTLYDYDRRFLEQIDAGIELGRSFVAAAWQREFLPLQLLWRGIATFVSRDPEHHVLFGAVSISGSHDAVSKQMMVDHLRRHLHPRLSQLARPRHPVRDVERHLLPLQWTETMIADLGHVDAMVAEIEPELRGVPVLLREYLKLGGQLVALDVDPNFQDSITALILIDLRRTDARLLGRYMGKQQAREFRQWHAARRLGSALDCA